MNKNRNVIREIAAERIEILYSLSCNALKEEPALSKRYINLMKSISTHYKVPLPKRIKGRMCKNCMVPLVLGVNSSTRIASSQGYIVIRCNTCGSEQHQMYKKSG